jgi:transcriptional repressor NrdR
MNGIVIIKRNGVKKPFDQQKITKSIETALRKRVHNTKQIEDIVHHVTSQLENTSQKEISSRMVGKLIMQELAKIDHVAYIRFASVYHDFNNAEDFAKFINKITER